MSDPKSVTTGECRLSYLRAFKPYAHKAGDEPKYGVTVLVPKNDFATRAKLDNAIAQAIAEGVTSKWNGVRPPVIAIPLHDGDGVRPSDGMPFGEECKGHWVFSANSKDQPKVVDLSVQPILNQSDVYSGMYGRVAVKFFPYINSGKKGIGCGLSNIQKTRDGEALGSRTSAEQDFADSAQFAQTIGQAVPQSQAYYTPQTPYNSAPQYAPNVPQIDPVTGLPFKPFGT